MQVFNSEQTVHVEVKTLTCYVTSLHVVFFLHMSGCGSELLQRHHPRAAAEDL